MATPRTWPSLRADFTLTAKKHILDGDFLGLVALDDGLQALEDFVEAVGDRSARGGVDGSDGDAMQLAGWVEFDDTVTGMLGAAIDAENAHYLKSREKLRE